MLRVEQGVAMLVIPSKTASPARAEGSRQVTLKLSHRDPSTHARDDLLCARQLQLVRTGA